MLLSRRVMARIDEICNLEHGFLKQSLLSTIYRNLALAIEHGALKTEDDIMKYLDKVENYLKNKT